ncbi:putative membrane protein YphA (DoxX/SURF4 family) [Halorubrum trapanicum]|uniref:Putative membrane protein YphA (DoxX/SURF4 family) n=1 Tax=Halorubrum trapanicum TaxID=29284 RepID=A0A8J7UNU0_9EURY|nr:DoxX family protein [Halorubrum trapanicum]MBP1900698.1 putative membrane protein YphA (DoxX/SURF4 family) [Halorubrum trapanicum]
MLAEITTLPLQFDTPFAGELFLLGRILFGATLAFMGLNHFMDLETMTGYAEFKGLPAPQFSVIASGAVLVLGGLGVAAGAYPVVSAGALAVFLLVSAVTMHDFWSLDDPEEKQNEMTSFLKNLYGAGAALALLAVGGTAWPYAVGIGLF